MPIVQRLARHADVKAKLAEERKRREKLDCPDFVWHELLGSFWEPWAVLRVQKA